MMNILLDTYALIWALDEVLRYIHKNPLRAGIVEQLKDFRWSSHGGYISRAKKWQWLHSEFLQGILASKKDKQHEAYLEFVSRMNLKQ